MKLTEELLATFIGGDIEIQNTGEGYLFRGRIKTAKIEDDLLVIQQEWTAKNDGGPNLPTSTWTVDDKNEYGVNLQLYSVSDVGDGRVMLNSPFVGEIAILFPKGGSQLDPSKVSGLEST